MSEHESPNQSRPAAKGIPEYITALKSILDAIEDEPDVFLDLSRTAVCPLDLSS